MLIRLLFDRMLLCAALGIKFGSDPDLTEFVMSVIDTDQSGSIDFIEFLQYIPFFIKLHSASMEMPTEVNDAPASADSLVHRVKMNLEMESTDHNDD
jgi:hypothetical protein